MYAKFSGLTDFVMGHPEFKGLIEAVRGSGGGAAPSGRPAWEGMVLAAAKPCLIAALHLSLGRPMMVVTARPERAKELRGQLEEWASAQGLVRLFPEPAMISFILKLRTRGGKGR